MEAKPPKAQLIEEIVKLRKKRKTFAPETIEKIVTLRKQGNTLEFIASEVKSNANYIITVLRRELGGEYDTYRVLGTITNESAQALIGLRKKGKTYSEMSHKTKLSFQSIDSFFSESSRLLFDKIIARLYLNISEQVSSEMFELYQKVWEMVRLRFKKAGQLVPIVVYMFTKIKGINIDIKELKESSELTQDQFRNCLKEAIWHCPEYMARNRNKVIYKKLSTVATYFSFEEEFLPTALVLLKKFWYKINNTTDNVIAGVISILTMIKLGIIIVTPVILCERLGIMMSSIYYHIRHNILPPEEATQFTGFRKSSDLLLRSL